MLHLDKMSAARSDRSVQWELYDGKTRELAMFMAAGGVTVGSLAAACDIAESRSATCVALAFALGTKGEAARADLGQS